MKKRIPTFRPSSRLCSLYFPFKQFLILLLLFSAFLCGLNAQAQTHIRVTGIVKDDKGAPAANASITVKGSKNGASTDANGAFAIDVPSEKSVLVISYLGFGTQELAVGKQTSL